MSSQLPLSVHSVHTCLKDQRVATSDMYAANAQPNSKTSVMLQPFDRSQASSRAIVDQTHLALTGPLSSDAFLLQVMKSNPDGHAEESPGLYLWGFSTRTNEANSDYFACCTPVSPSSSVGQLHVDAVMELRWVLLNDEQPALASPPRPRGHQLQQPSSQQPPSRWSSASFRLMPYPFSPPPPLTRQFVAMAASHLHLPSHHASTGA